MPAPDYTIEIAALQAGLGSGEAKIVSDGDEVTYRGVADIMAAISYFERRRAQASGARRSGGSTLAVFEAD